MTLVGFVIIFSLSHSLSPSLPQTVPQVCARQGGLGFDSELQELYSAVTSYGNTNARKRKISERHAPEEDQSTTEDRDPNHAASGTQPPGLDLSFHWSYDLSNPAHLAVTSVAQGLRFGPV